MGHHTLPFSVVAMHVSANNYFIFFAKCFVTFKCLQYYFFFRTPNIYFGMAYALKNI
jgi:hypothetical protein